MMSVTGAVFVATLAIWFCEKHVNSAEMVNRIEIVDEFRRAPSLLFDGATVKIPCNSSTYPTWLNLAVNGAIINVIFITSSSFSNGLAFLLRIDNETQMGSYYCAEKNGTDSTTKVDIFYRLCDTCQTCLKNDECGKNFNYSYVNQNNQEMCTTLDQLNAGNINALVGSDYDFDFNWPYDHFVPLGVFCVQGEKTALKSLFEGLSLKKKLLFTVAPIHPLPHGEIENVCNDLKFEIIDINSNPISMGSAILYDNNIYLNLSCNGITSAYCLEEASDVMPYRPVNCGERLVIKIGEDAFVSKVARLTCEGYTPYINKSSFSYYFRVQTYIYLVHMDTRIQVSAEPSLGQLWCSFSNPLRDDRFSITANLFLNGVKIQSQLVKNEKFSGGFVKFNNVEKDYNDYECQLVLKFKSCYMQAEFTRVACMKVNGNCDKPATTTNSGECNLIEKVLSRLSFIIVLSVLFLEG